MLLRILAWVGVLLGGVITAERLLLPPHYPNLVWLLLFVLGVAYFIKNGFLRPKAGASGGKGAGV